MTEITSLPYGCLEQDKDGDWLLKIVESKMKRSYLLPISKECYEAIQAQQEDVMSNPKYTNQDYLFPCQRKKALTKFMNTRNIERMLNKLSEKYAIQDINGQVWHFHPHQFRHTVGTRMINAGVSQIMVQKYLGHESAEMTMRYAHIHDQTLKEVFKKFEGKLIDIRGKQRDIEALENDALWLKKNIMAQALPNGLCTLPLQQKRCPHANACLSCGHFRTTQKHLPQHKVQLEQTITFIEKAKAHGLTQQVEVNENLKINLETIIHRLEDTKHEAGK